jgi:hypothetical protein
MQEFCDFPFHLTVGEKSRKKGKTFFGREILKLETSIPERE